MSSLQPNLARSSCRWSPLQLHHKIGKKKTLLWLHNKIPKNRLLLRDLGSLFQIWNFSHSYFSESIFPMDYHHFGCITKFAKITLRPSRHLGSLFLIWNFSHWYFSNRTSEPMSSIYCPPAHYSTQNYCKSDRCIVEGAEGNGVYCGKKEHAACVADP